MEDSRERKHVESDEVEKGYNESFSVRPEFNRAAEYARKAAEESASANAESKEAYKRYSKWLIACNQSLVSVPNVALNMVGDSHFVIVM